jgi:hypothetical protein
MTGFLLLIFTYKGEYSIKTEKKIRERDKGKRARDREKIGLCLKGQ